MNAMMGDMSKEIVKFENLLGFQLSKITFENFQYNNVACF